MSKTKLLNNSPQPKPIRRKLSLGDLLPSSPSNSNSITEVVEGSNKMVFD